MQALNKAKGRGKTLMSQAIVKRTDNYVEIEVDTSTYLFTPEQYAELYSAVTMTPPDDSKPLINP
jgi:hypothetical protein